MTSFFEKNKKIISNFIIVILAALALVSIVQGCRNALLYSQDFQWDATKTLLMRINPYLESLNPSGILNAYGYEEYYKQMEANQFPSLLLLLTPYTCLPPLAARYAWLLSNLVFTALVILLLKKTYFQGIDGKYFLMLALLMIAGTPWRNQIGVGQHTIFSLLFFLLAVWFSDRERQILAALCLCISYFKYTLTVPLALYFVYKRKWKELILSVIPHIILTVFSAWWLKASVISMIVDPLKVSSALSGEGSMDIGAMLGGGTFTMVLTVLLLLLLFVLVLKMPADQDLLVIAILVVWSLLITYHRSYDYFVLILPFAWLLSKEQEDAGENKRRKFCLYYGFVIIFAVFFGLRVCHESELSLYVVGMLCYGFALYMTAIGVRKIRKVRLKG